MQQVAGSSLSRNQEDFGIPYQRSWVDSLIHWIRAVPGPSWLLYAAILLGIALLNNVVFWLDGSLAPGSFHPIRLLNAVFTIYPIALYHHLALIAGRSYQVFRPLLKAPASDQGSLEHQLTTLPRRLGWLAIVLGFGIAVPSALSDPASVLADVAITVLPIIYQSIALSITLSSLLALIFQTVRQLRLVNDLHQQAPGINLFDLAPAHAFANLTSRAGIGLIGLILFMAWLASVAQTSLNEEQLVSRAAMGFLSVATFFLPLLGMRNRLKDGKARLLGEANVRMQQTIAQIHD